MVEKQGKSALRLMRPMKITKGCLKCHGHQASYLNTESAGGVSITVPLAEIYSDAIASFKNTIIMHIIFFITGLIFINLINKKERKSRKQLNYYANNDSLTGLLNRHAYTEKIEILIKNHNVKTIYVLFMDLDNFKTINDTLGHTIGDLLLQNVAKLLQNEITDVEMFVRFGGDEFILVFTNIERIQTLESKIQKIHAIFNKAFILDNYEVHTSASIGISAYPENSDDIESLLKNADIAMYHAKHSGRNKHAFYKSEMMGKSKNELTLENDLHKALQNDELYLLYQPQISLKTEKIVGVEALIRWKNPNHGTISPVVFIPIAETNGLIMPIGEWIIDTACNQLASWRDTPMKELMVSINISAKQLMHQDLYGYIKNTIIKTGINAKLLEIEITESVIMENINETVKILEKLKTLGLSIAIDDFGTGYSSLSYLKKLPIDRLKIDREFIKNIPDDKDDIAITKAIVSLAKALELTIVAEGPETQTQINFLKESQCDIAQGYFYAKPLSANEVEVFFN